MKSFFNLTIYLLLFIALQGCNTLFNTRTIDIEIIEPGRVRIPEKYKIVAVKFNNVNIKYNPNFAEYYKGTEILTDSANTDSIASKVYYSMFIESLKQQQFFDSVYELKPRYYSNVNIIDSLISPLNKTNDSLYYLDDLPPEITISFFAALLKKFPLQNKKNASSKILDPNFGLYSKEEIQQIADSTNADILLSFDYFATIDGSTFKKKNFEGLELVYTTAFWNFYDLHELKLKYFYDRLDTISWKVGARNIDLALKELPPRKDAILNAADVAGGRFAEFLIPHWIPVQRMYYYSGQLDIKETDKLIKEGNWIKAAKIWKKYVNNPNKAIAAKCLFNMGLACEMQGDIDAAIDWVVRSFHIFGQKNEANYFNCMDYIRILAQRKQDIKKIELQLNDDN